MKRKRHSAAAIKARRHEEAIAQAAFDREHDGRCQCGKTHKIKYVVNGVPSVPKCRAFGWARLIAWPGLKPS